MNIAIQLVQIILRQRAPEDIDYSAGAALFLVIANFGLQAMTLGSVSAYSMPLAYAAVYTLANVLAIYAIMTVHNKQPRFVQTLTALFGVSLILHIMAMFAAVSGPLAFTSIMITFWQIFLLILILRTALDCSTVKAVLLTMLYQFFIGFSLILVFPEFQTEFSSIWQQTMEQAQKQ